jgi:RND family efflux transporter MFP subunit
MRSRVEGQVVFVSERLETGSPVEEGELLVRLEQSGFRLRVAEAENRLAAAEISLMREEREAKDARENWHHSGIEGEPASPLVLREPQLAAARSDVKAARASLSYALTMLGHTEIRAPFAAVVVRRNINPGEMVFEADKVATLFGTGSVEIKVSIDSDSWLMLPELIGEAEATIYDTGQSASWQADVVRKSYHLDEESRLRTLILQVHHPMDQTPPLLPGTFVKVEITGRQVPHLLQIPESALTIQGLVWFVDHDRRLQKYHLDPVFYGKGVVYIPAPETTEKSPLLVAVFPNSGFINGQVVQPLPEKGVVDDR